LEQVELINDVMEKLYNFWTDHDVTNPQEGIRSYVNINNILKEICNEKGESIEGQEKVVEDAVDEMIESEFIELVNESNTNEVTQPHIRLSRKGVDYFSTIMLTDEVEFKANLVIPEKQGSLN